MSDTVWAVGWAGVLAAAVVVVWVVPMVKSRDLFHERGYSPRAGLLVGFVFGYFGLAVAALLPYRRDWVAASVPVKSCPHCAEEIRVAATVCRYCGRDV